MSKLFLVAALLFTILAVGETDAARDTAEAPGPRTRGGAAIGQNGPCAEDLKKFCSNVAPGGGAVFECMKKNEAQVSQGCKNHMVKMVERIQPMKEAFQAVRDACVSDVEKFCKDAPSGNGGKIRCLHANESKPDFSQGCKEAIAKMKQMKPPGGMLPPPAALAPRPSPTPTK